MKFLTSSFTRMRNAEHFQIMTEFKELLETMEAIKLKVNKLFLLFLQLFLKEDKCLLVIQKSYYTEKIYAADHARDTTFRGLCDVVNSLVNHFNAQKAEAGKKLKILLKTYGNLAQKPADEETAGIYNLVQELEGNYAEQVQIAGITEWVSELKQKNEDYEALVKSRDIESSEKPDENMREVRTEVDQAYRDITQTIESLALLADDEEKAIYETFISEFNAVITRYNNRLAARQGKGSEQSKSQVEAALEEEQE